MYLHHTNMILGRKEICTFLWPLILQTSVQGKGTAFIFHCAHICLHIYGKKLNSGFLFILSHTQVRQIAANT